MGVLADEYVRVRADTSYLGRDLKKEGVKSGKTFGTGFSGAFKGLIGAGAVFGVLAGATSLLKDASAAARESWKVGRQTQAVLKSTGGAARVTQQDIEKLTAAISAKTGIDDEAIQSSANMLLTFTNVRNELGKGNDVFNQATQIVQDMSVALGQDGKNSAIQLGKALNDPIKGVSALRRVGVTFTDQQKEQIKTLVESGNTLGAQKIILAELSKEFGGSAEAQATWADKTRVAWDNVKETIGGFLNESLEPVARWFVEEGIPAVQDFFETLSTDPALKQAVQNLKDALAALTGDQDFKASLDGIARALPPIVQGLADVVTKYGEISAAVDKFENMSFAEGDKTGGPVGQIVKDFGAGGTIETALIEFRGFIGTHVKQGWTDAKASFTENHAAIVADLDRFWEKVKSAWTTATTWLKTTWTAFWTAVKTKAVAVWESVRAYIAGVWAKVKALWTSATTAVKTTWNTFWTNIKSAASTALEWVRSKVTTVLDKVKTAFSTGVEAIGRAWDKIKEKARVPVAFVVNTVINDGLLKAVRAVSKFVNYAPGEKISVSMARGGVLPGYTPGRDVHRFYSATGGVLDLSGGEGIVRPELVKAIGAGRLNAANRAARVGDIDKGTRYLGGFAQGGTISGIDAAKRYARSIGINSITTYPTHGTPDDPARNWDFMTSNKAKGDKMADWLWQNRRSIHLWYEIWYRRIRSMTRESAGWRPYTRSNPHTDHVHASWYSSALAGALSNIVGGLGGLDPGKYLKMVTGAMGKLKGIGSGQFGQMVAGVPRLIVDKIKEKITGLASSFMGAVGGSGFTAAGGGSNRAIGHRMMLQRWGENQWPPLNSLWTKESGWRTTARNPSSGAYGIPQSLPASKMASAGSDWRTNPATQIKWGLGYIASRYGSPSAAWAHSQRTNWYGMGGVIREPVMGFGLHSGRRYGFGERGPETVTPGVGGGRPITILIDLGEGLVQRVQGLIDENDEFKATVGRAR